MEDNTSRLHSVALSESESDESKKISDDKPLIKKKTSCFKRNDENDKVYFMWFDCCAWCLEFQQKKWCCCKESVYCNLCCCRIHFY